MNGIAERFYQKMAKFIALKILKHTLHKVIARHAQAITRHPTTLNIQQTEEKMRPK